MPLANEFPILLNFLPIDTQHEISNADAEQFNPQEPSHKNQYLLSADNYLRPASLRQFLVLCESTGVSGAEL
jgi:hypothetical protein